MVVQLQAQFAGSQQKADGFAQIVRAHEQRNWCETLYAKGRIADAAVSLLEIKNTASKAVRANKLIMDWLAGESLHRT